jgi:hypothetical protein
MGALSDTVGGNGADAVSIGHSGAGGSGGVGAGGGIFNSLGTLTIVNCTLTGNKAGGGQGGQGQSAQTGGIGGAGGPGGTVNGNGGNGSNAPNGGDGGSSGVALGGAIALGASSGAVSVTNCTVFGNQTAAGQPGFGGAGAKGGPGGIGGFGNGLPQGAAGANGAASQAGAAGSVALVAGGGFQVAAGSTAPQVLNTIIAGNTNASAGADVAGTFSSSGHNLIGDGTTGSGFGQNGDQVGTTASPIDPKLGTLTSFNGGPTATMALLAGSPAISAGSATGAPDSDQRGFLRADPPDIGAFQLTANITGISPATGLTAGGTMVTITGGSLANATEVDFGTNRATIDSYNAATHQLLVTSPGGKVGMVDVIVKTADGISMLTSADQFTYVAGPPILTVTDAGGVYNGQPFSASATATTAGGASVAGSFAFTYTDSHNNSSSVAPTNAGAYTVVVQFTSSDSSYTNAQSAPVSFTITPATLTVTGITAGNKVYDGTTAATLNVSNAQLQGVVNGDTVLLNTGNASGAFASIDAGTATVVTVSGLTISGTAVTAGDYILTQPTTSANITVRTLTVTGITAGNRMYNGNAAATLNVTGAKLVGVVSGDNVILNTDNGSGAFPSKNAGSNLVVTVSGLKIGGGQAADYALTQPTTTANITPFALTVSATGQNKVYDGTTKATVTLSDNRIAGDQFSASYNSASFAGKNVTATAQTVSVSGISLSGPDAANYTFNTTATTTARILPAPLTVAGITAGNKVYDGSTRATLTVNRATLQGVIGGDSVTLNTSHASGTFASKNVGNGIAVTVSGLSLNGSAATLGNYTLTQPATTANITPAPLTVTGITANNKVYDGTTTATLNLASATLKGLISGDSVTLNTSNAAGTFASRHVGTGIAVTVSGLSLSGAAALVGDYTLTPPTTTANITPRPITVTAAADTETYDGTTVSSQTPTITSGSLAAGDNASFMQTFDTKNAGTGKTLTPSGSVLDGNSGKDYKVTFVSNTHGEIDKALLTVQANNITWVLGRRRPALTYTLSGLVDGDSAGVVSGNPLLTTSATSNSTAGAYLINVSQGSLAASNYVFQFLGGTLTLQTSLVQPTRPV